MPMNCRRSFPGKGLNNESSTDIQRVISIWRECREKYGEGGSLLFGKFTVADAMYAPVAQRFRTYDVHLDEISDAYVSAILSLPEMKEWISSATTEEEVLEEFEPYHNEIA
jgi:glutathione S-transferase